MLICLTCTASNVHHLDDLVRSKFKPCMKWQNCQKVIFYYQVTNARNCSYKWTFTCRHLKRTCIFIRQLKSDPSTATEGHAETFLWGPQTFLKIFLFRMVHSAVHFIHERRRGIGSVMEPGVPYPYPTVSTGLNEILEKQRTTRMPM